MMNFLLLLFLVFGPTFAFVEESLSDLTVNMLSALSESKEKDENILFSPSSVFIGVGMLYIGMDGNTREAVKEAMNFPDDEKIFNKTLMEFTKPSNSSPKFSANMITISKDAEINKDYAKGVVDLFHANPFVQDFGKDPERTRKSVNIWVSRRTNRKIRGLMPPGSVRADTSVVLVNALYFKLDWAENFDDFLTQEAFTTSDGREQTVDMMTSKQRARYGKVEGAEVVSLSFDDEDFQFVIVLPEEGKSPEELIKTMGDSKLMEAVRHPNDELDEKTVMITMPKFKAEMSAELTGVLREIPGLDKMVAPSADFSLMSKKPIKVGDVQHKAVIEVTETGVEAAAATSISIVPYANFPQDIEMKLNRPFLYFIVEQTKGAIQIAGILNNPKNVKL